MTRTLNPPGLALIKKWESLRLEAYQDQRGVWTIGWGHTGGVYSGMAVDAAQATSLLIDDLSYYEEKVDGLVPTQGTTDNEFAAMVSLAYNIGVAGFCTSTVLRMHLAGHHPIAAEAFLMWDKIHIDGVLTYSPGLFNRRLAERALYLEPSLVVAV